MPKHTQAEFLALSGEDLAKLSRRELQSYVKTANRLVETRVSALTRAGLDDSPAVRALRRDVGGRIAANTSKAQMLSDLRQAAVFGRSALSTVTGYRAALSEAAEALRRETGGRKIPQKSITTEQIQRVYGPAARLAYSREGKMVISTTADRGTIDASQVADMWNKFHKLRDSGKLARFSGGSGEIFQQYFDAYAESGGAEDEDDILARMEMSEYDDEYDDEFTMY